MIRDQLIEHTNMKKVREKLLLQPDEITLSRALQLAFRVESAADCVAHLKLLDICQGYLQVYLHPSSRCNLFAFMHAGVFRYKCMAFGLSSASSCFPENNSVHPRRDPRAHNLSG